MRKLLCALSVLAAGCGRYGDFTLAVPPPGSAVHYRLQVRPQPVLDRGAPGAWDSADVLNPSVLRHKGALLNLYSGFDGKTWHTGVATSADGIDWAKHGRILSPGPATWEGGYIAANGSAVSTGNEVLYWYQAGNPPRIGLARSGDLKTWTKHGEPVLDPGPVGSWDEKGVADPYVIRVGADYFLFYLGMDRAQRQRLGVARSADGVIWTKLRANPVLDLGADREFDENGLGEPAVWAAGGRYWMLYTGRDRHEVRRIGMAESNDGVHWRRSASLPVFAGSEDWNSKVVCDPTVEVDGAKVRIWFGGGNVPRPDERINGAIGYAELVP